MEKKQNDNAQKQKKEQERPVTRAEKAGRMKAILRELLTERNYRWNEILDVSAKVYVEKYPGETDDLNDLKGKFGSVFSLMEDAGEMRFQAGVCSLVQTGKAEEKAPVKTPEKSPEKALSKAPVKEEKKSEKAEKVSEKTAEESEKPVGTEAKTQEKPAGKSGAGTRKRSARKSAAETKAEANQVPASASAPEGAAPALSAEKPENRPAEGENAAAQPAEPVKSAEKVNSEAPVSEKPAPAKRGRKPRTASVSAAPVEQAPAETATEEKAPARRRGRKPKAAESGKSGEIKTQTAQTTQTSQTPQTAEKAEIPAEKTATTEGEAVVKAEVSETADRAVTEKKTDGEVDAALPAGEKESGKEVAAVFPSEPAEAVISVGEKAVSGKQEIAEKAGDVAEKQLETEKAAEKQPSEAKQAEKITEQTGVPAVRPEAKVAPVFDMTLLFGGTAKKPAKAPVGGREEKRPARAEQAAGAEKEQALGKAEEKVKEKGDDGRGTAVMEKEPVRRSDKPAVRAAMPEFAFLGNAAAREKSGAQMSGAQGVRTAEVRPVKTGAKAEEKEGAGTPVRNERQGASASVQPIARPRNSAASPERQTAKEAGQVSGNGANVSANAVGNAAVSAPVSGNSGNNGTNGNNGNSGNNGNRRGRRGGRGRAPQGPETPEDALKAEFLKRLRSLGGDYFEYYSVYLLERYSLRNGRRLEGLRVSGGEHDGGIDGEIELTDKFGFRETIYIQAKNWDPSKGDLDKWVVGETLLQQFIGAVTCRLAKEGKQHSRGIFVTTSRFTPEARELLETMSDRFVGYDADDVFEAAKECSFGLVQKNGEWVLDEALLSGGKAFFNMI